MYLHSKYFSIILISGVLALLKPISGLCSFEHQNNEEIGPEQAPRKTTFQVLVQEKNGNFQECLQLMQQESQNTGNALLLRLLFSGNNISQAELEEIKSTVQLQEQEQAARQARMDALELRNQEIDKELPEALLDWFRQREQEHALVVAEKVEALLTSCSIDVACSTDEFLVKQKVIQVPSKLPNNAKQTFYIDYDPDAGLWLGMELLQHTNVDWWQERLGWEATMQFGLYSQNDWLFKSAIFMDSFDNRSIESKLEQAFCPKLFGEPSVIRFENEYELMALRTTPIEKTPTAFQQAYQAYKPSESETDRANYLAAFRGFKMNLDRYKMVPTWVAYYISEKVDGPLCTKLDPTSSQIKMAMTVTVGGPFYSPLGIFSSSIARACDSTPCTRLSGPFHIGVAKMMGEIDPEILYGATRPLENIFNIFQKIGLPFSSSFKFEFTNNKLPVILREGNYKAQDGESILFHTGRYTPFVLYDPRTNTTYQIGHYHPFVTNYYLGGIMARDMKYPFVTFDRETLANMGVKK